LSGTNLRQRLTAILAADVAGYSRLMSADEHATVAGLDAARAVFRARIETGSGRVIDMAGDSVLAVFDTATGAVSTALAIQDELARLTAGVPEERRMRFRIGVHLGDVIEKADGTVYGDGVNIAARLEGLAQPGGVTVSDSVCNAVKGRVGAEFEDQGEQTVKNIPYPVRTFGVRPREAAGAPYRPGDPAGIASRASDPSGTRAVAEGSGGAPSLVHGMPSATLSERPSIAVLPLKVLAEDSRIGFLADGSPRT